MFRLLDKLFSRNFISKTNTRLFTTHRSFDPDCFSNFQIHSLRTRLNTATDTLSLGDLRMGGIAISLGFYDSHRFDTRTQHTQATQAIVLVLPESDSCTQDYGHLIGTLVEKNVRVLSVEFPGCGTSRFVEVDADPVYKNLMVQKMSIVHDFLSLRLPNRKK